ncbi:hypothetical protein HK407_14g18740, partial [Ordospora pajunii]|uniref:uncharacterized protein n=1 Tax=Ordospora pajunii TaxID=3039483 RepID=UPI0029527FBA
TLRSLLTDSLDVLLCMCMGYTLQMLHWQSGMVCMMLEHGIYIGAVKMDRLVDNDNGLTHHG